jgi:hypothetical protein
VGYALTIHDQKLGNFFYHPECADDERSLTKGKKAGDIRKFYLLFGHLYLHCAKLRIVQNHHCPPSHALGVGSGDVHAPHPPDLTYLVFIAYQVGQASLKP